LKVAPVQPPPIPENVAGTSIQAQKQLHQMQQQQQQQHINIIPTIASSQVGYNGLINYKMCKWINFRIQSNY